MKRLFQVTLTERISNKLIELSPLLNGVSNVDDSSKMTTALMRHLIRSSYVDYTELGTMKISFSHNTEGVNFNRVLTVEVGRDVFKAKLENAPNGKQVLNVSKVICMFSEVKESDCTHSATGGIELALGTISKHYSTKVGEHNFYKSLSIMGSSSTQYTFELKVNDNHFGCVIVSEIPKECE